MAALHVARQPGTNQCEEFLFPQAKRLGPPPPILFHTHTHAL